MMILCVYDIGDVESDFGKKRLRKVAKCCLNYGQRVQNSVYECVVKPDQFLVMKSSILNILDLSLDSVRFYHFGNNYLNKVEHYGVKISYDPGGLLEV